MYVLYVNLCMYLYVYMYSMYYSIVCMYLCCIFNMNIVYCVCGYVHIMSTVNE